jgi:hypothetical protein
VRAVSPADLEAVIRVLLKRLLKRCRSALTCGPQRRNLVTMPTLDWIGEACRLSARSLERYGIMLRQIPFELKVD